VVGPATSHASASACDLLVCFWNTSMKARRTAGAIVLAFPQTKITASASMSRQRSARCSRMRFWTYVLGWPGTREGTPNTGLT